MKTQISWSPFSLTTTLTSRDGPFVGHDTLKATVPLWGGNDTLTVSGGSKYYYYFSFLGKNYKLSMSLAVTGSGKLNSGIVGATVITVLAAELAALSPDILAAIMLILAQLALRTLVPAFEGQL